MTNTQKNPAEKNSNNGLADNGRGEAGQATGETPFVKVGRFKVRIFENINKQDGSVYYKASPIVRWYKDENTGQFKPCSVSEDELDEVIEAAYKAKEKIRELKNKLSPQQLPPSVDTSLAGSAYVAPSDVTA